MSPFQSIRLREEKQTASEKIQSLLPRGAMSLLRYLHHRRKGKKYRSRSYSLGRMHSFGGSSQEFEEQSASAFFPTSSCDESSVKGCVTIRERFRQLSESDHFKAEMLNTTSDESTTTDDGFSEAPVSHR